MARMKNTIRTLCLLLSFVTVPSIAKWDQGSFNSGNLKHYFANSGPNRHGTELELFCSNHDSRLSAALYLPSHRFLNRNSIKVHIRIDKLPLWTFTGTRHAMAVTVPSVPDKLLTQLSEGSRVVLTFPVAKSKSQTEQFILQNSSKTLASLQSSCESKG